MIYRIYMLKCNVKPGSPHIPMIFTSYYFPSKFFKKIESLNYSKYEVKVGIVYCNIKVYVMN